MTRARDLSNRASDFVSVKDFGAVGDGVVDDTAAIQAAIDYAQTATNFATYGSNSPSAAPISVFFPCGYYKISDALLVTAPVTLIGDGASEYSSGARIYQSNKDADCIQVNPQASGMSFGMQNMTLRHNNANDKNGAGVLLRVNKTTANCNSQRYINCTFGQPANSVAVITGDDIVFQNCLFDISYGQGLEIGTSTVSASNVRIINCDFFGMHQRCISITYAKDIVVTGCTVYTDVTSTQFFIDAYNTLPTQVQNVSITGNSFYKVRTIAALKNIENFNFTGNACKELGNGSGETQAAFEMYGTCSNVVISSNSFSGSYDSSHFYTDNGSTAVNTANISGNAFYNTAGGGAALICSKTTGVIANNSFTGFTIPSISETFTTGTIYSGGGTLTAGNYGIYSGNVTNSQINDSVNITYGSSIPFDYGVFNQTFVGTAGTYSILYMNPTASSKNITQHTLKVTVSRGI